ncbi:diacylglycerol/polyprenol kinase family protein [Spirochaeta africana]|nr:phosphatidate cytidylyltransferase [Spirochaeta africana]
MGYDLQRELLRKTIHMLIALVPTIAVMIGVGPAIALLASGIIVYTYAEVQRLNGHPVFLISRLTQMASRERDFGHFVLGPVSLGLGALLALLFYPYPAAALAIYALAFGDGISSVVGKLFGRIRIPGTGGKTVAGSLSCFVAILAAGSAMLHNPMDAVIIAVFGTAIEALPSKDFDNILLPMGVGLMVQVLAII